MNSLSFLQILRKYVIEHEGITRLGETSDMWPMLPAPITVYRGHRSNATIIRRGNALYSSTSDKNVAVDEFAGDTCCVFKIHLPAGTHYLDVNAHMGHDHSKAHEKEIIFEGGGTFYTDSSYTHPGVTQIREFRGRRVFETYYVPSSLLQISPQRLSPSASPSHTQTSPRSLTLQNLIDRYMHELEDEFLYDEYMKEGVSKGEAFLAYVRDAIGRDETIPEEVEKQFIKHINSSDRTAGGSRRRRRSRRIHRL
jgi:hypothetical protein